MSESKPLKNGHDPVSAAESPNPATVRGRRYRERKRRGVVILQAEIQPDMTQALVQLGWLHESEARNRMAITAAIGALVYQALSAAMRPAHPGKVYVPVGLDAVRDATCWIRRGEPITAESAGQALGTLSAAAATVGFDPQAFTVRLHAMTEELLSRGIVGRQSTAH
jgi:hypothetical protein